MEDTEFVENQPWGKTSYTITPDSHISFNTAIQKVDFITNPVFGRMLFLDGVLQSSSADEEIYHKALVGAAVGLGCHKILIAGGAEGAVAREVLKWPGIDSIQMVDWDSQLVHHIQTVEKMNTRTWEDSRLSYSGKDIVRFCEETNKTFDTVILDLLDIESEADLTMMFGILKWVFMIVEPRAKIVMNIGRNKEYAEKIQGSLGKGDIIEIIVPSFQEPWFLLSLSL